MPDPGDPDGAGKGEPEAPGEPGEHGSVLDAILRMREELAADCREPTPEEQEEARELRKKTLEQIALLGLLRFQQPPGPPREPEPMLELEAVPGSLGLLKVVIVGDERGATGSAGAQDDVVIGRPLEPLVLPDVRKAEEDLRKRAELPELPRSGPLTYTAIATRAKLSRDRLHQFEELMRLGWPLDRSHPEERLRKSRPDFPTDAEPVWLPTPRQARRLLDLV